MLCSPMAASGPSCDVERSCRPWNNKLQQPLLKAGHAVQHMCHCTRVCAAVDASSCITPSALGRNACWAAHLHDSGAGLHSCSACCYTAAPLMVKSATIVRPNCDVHHCATQIYCCWCLPLSCWVQLLWSPELRAAFSYAPVLVPQDSPVSVGALCFGMPAWFKSPCDAACIVCKVCVVTTACLTSGPPKHCMLSQC